MALLAAMEYFAVVIWMGGTLPTVEPPAVVCRAWSPDEPPVFDEDEREQEWKMYELGRRACNCFSRVAREGEFGHLHGSRLYPFSELEFRRAVEMLASYDLPDYEEYVYEGRGSEPCPLRLAALSARARVHEHAAAAGDRSRTRRRAVG